MNIDSSPILIFPQANRTFWVFERPDRVWTSSDVSQRFWILREAERWAKDRGTFLAGGIPYASDSEFAAGWWGAFGSPKTMTLSQLRRYGAAYSPVVGPLTSRISRPEYSQAFEAVKKALENGDSYQINLTFLLEGTLGQADFGAASYLSLWLDLWEHGQGELGAFVLWNDSVLISLSPELFFQCEDSSVTCRPMKGTALRNQDPQVDQEQKRILLESEKTRAENLMITDMIRNDLGKIALPGSVSVPKLFTVEMYPTVWQMTSTVVAQLPRGLEDPLTCLVEALFPCASITGAPKIRSCQIIERVEESKRGWYTGALGWCRPSDSQNLQARFNVAIRTLEVRKDNSFTLGVGGGIVWDSDVEEEWQEAWNKSKFLLTAQRNFSLTEALLWTPEEGFFLTKEHEERLARACLDFGGTLDIDLFRQTLAQAEKDLKKTKVASKVRIVVDPNFALSYQCEPLLEMPEVLSVALARRPHDDTTLIYRKYKTTNREIYEREKQSGVDQVLHYNQRGELTESTSMNIVLELGGKRLTPALSSGLLDGTFRRYLIETNQVEEAVLTIHDLKRASKIFLINSVRRWKIGQLRSDNF